MNDNAPFFTIATITFNSEKWVRHTITSILSSTFVNFELLISDDCSTDSTWAIISEFKDSRIRAWRNEKNIGEYPNRNKTLNLARGKYILYIDGDDILYKHTLYNLNNYLQTFPQAGMVWGVPQPDFIVFPYELSSYQICRIEYLSSYYWSMIGFPETIFKTELLKKYNGFDERFAIGDYFIKRKLALHSPVLVVHKGFAFWRTREGQASQNISKGYKILIEQFMIDEIILNSDCFPLKGDEYKKALSIFKFRTINSIINNTLRKGKLFSFIWLFMKFKIKLSDLFILFKPRDNFDKFNRNGEAPFYNEYNF